MAAIINDAYYQQLTTKLQSATVPEFSAIMRQHKADMLATKFREPADKVFEQNLAWVADKVISQPGTRSLKDPDAITDTDMQKLEALKDEYGFDYMKDLRVNFTTHNRHEYSSPFMTYMGSKKSDFTDYQVQAVEKALDQLAREKRTWDIGISYSMRSGRGNNHNSDKNLFHVLVEGELTPNKKKVADLVAGELAQKSYRIYATTESWQGSYGQDIYQPWDTYRNALHSAVSSGRLENVEYALSKGAKQSTLYNGYGSTAFADAVERNTDPAYHAIAVRLFENALTLEDGAKILREASRWSRESNRPIQTLARFGDLPFTVAMAHANAGDPELAVESFTHSDPITLGNYHSVATGGEVIFHPPVHTTRTKTEYVVSETGRTEDPFPYIRQAVFNLDPKAGTYAGYQDIFGKAVAHLLEQGALKKSDIPEEKLSNPRALNFVFSLRAAADAEKARNPDFLAKTAVFTEGFVEEVKKAKSLTNSFRAVYDPANPEKTREKAYAAEQAAPAKAAKAKAPRKPKKPEKGSKP